MFRKIYNPFRIQYVSDLHLERYTVLPAFSTLLKPCAPYLALAGDIGQPAQLRTFFDWLVPQWKRIFYVAGNHEYYGAKYAERQRELEALTATYPNLHFLHVSSPSFYCEEANVAVVGLTLWSKVSRLSDWKTVADYRQIRFPGAPFPALNAQHDLERMTLATEIRRWGDVGAQVCVITHHLPSFRLLSPRFATSTVNDCFASHCDILLTPPVQLWIYGHTHSCSNQVLGSVLCLCNAKGYEDESVPGWMPNAWMEFPAMDPQEAEAIAKRDQTPLRTATYLEDSEPSFL